MSECLKCGKEMMDENGINQTGLTINMEKPKEQKKFWKKQMGKYCGKKLEFCYECWLDIWLGCGKYEVKKK